MFLDAVADTVTLQNRVFQNILEALRFCIFKIDFSALKQAYVCYVSVF